jgi:hypothetical protein
LSDDKTSNKEANNIKVEMALIAGVTANFIMP